jgi:hypothetical protein
MFSLRRVRLLATSLFGLVLMALSFSIAATPASAKVTFGYGEGRPDMFTDARWLALPLRDVRRTVDWDTPSKPEKLAALDVWMKAAADSGSRPLLAIDRRWDEGSSTKGPSIAQYTKLIKFLKGRYPTWKTLTPWNEANFRLQPTAKSPKLAFQYYQAAKKACKGCTVTSPVFLAGGGSADKWLKEFVKISKGKVKLWAYHGYGDNNRFTDKGFTKFEKTVKGQIWVTEAAGWVKFLDTGAWPYDEDRAAKVITGIFKTAKKHQSRIKRWYFYQWRGDVNPETRWDSGVLNADGSERAGYRALVAGLGK